MSSKRQGAQNLIKKGVLIVDERLNAVKHLDCSTSNQFKLFSEQALHLRLYSLGALF